ncbi:MAG TPA: glucose-1-phosphate cytidylyltransferase [Ignavibacteria bacterium]
MQVVILCGGKGTRISEETMSKPKPLVEIGGKPILWHIVKTYTYYGYNKFILALGYKGDMIKEYFYNLRIFSSDFKLNFKSNNNPEIIKNSNEIDCEILFVDTGESTLKGGRIKKIQKYISSDNFHLTYGDGVCDVDLRKLESYHVSNNSTATLTAVHPPSRFGELKLKGSRVMEFEEKPQMNKGYINGGFFVLNKNVFNYLTEDDDCDFEFGALQNIARENQLSAYKHKGFWQCMDNIRDRDYLNYLIKSKKAPWINW